VTPREAARVLLVAAHPDDIDYSCAGTIAGWTEAGVEVSYCIVTDGDAGGDDPSVPRAEMAALRREEQRKAGIVLGVSDIDFLGHPDGRVFVTYELRRDITRVIRRVRPDRVVLPPPVRNLRSMYGSHPDHTATGEAGMCAVYPDARNPFAHPELLVDEGLEPHTVGEVWVMTSTEEADHFVDITDRLDRKMAMPARSRTCRSSRGTSASGTPASPASGASPRAAWRRASSCSTPAEPSKVAPPTHAEGRPGKQGIPDPSSVKARTCPRTRPRPRAGSSSAS
jgi:LmbE family N-acetylglucosaminyl deacetylase